MLRSSLIASVIFLSACASNGEEAQPLMTKCNDPRPQICTMIYDPVCGLTKDKARKTYASDCSACADAEVVKFEKGECP